MTVRLTKAMIITIVIALIGLLLWPQPGTLFTPNGPTGEEKSISMRTCWELGLLILVLIDIGFQIRSRKQSEPDHDDENLGNLGPL